MSFIKIILIYQNMDTDEISMYVLINNDLKMEKGKIISQVGHAVEMATEKIMLSMYESNKIKQQHLDYLKYKNSGRRKIVLKATQQQMEEYKNDDNAVYVIDAGRTQVPENSLTAIAFLPCVEMKNKLKDLKLV